MRTIYKLMVVMLVVVLCAESFADTNQHKIQRFTENVTIKKPTTAKIINHYGDIRIRKADDEAFIYHGVAQTSAAQDVKFEFSHEGDVITAVVKYSKPDELTPQDRYDLAIVVPAGVTLDIEIERGRLSSKGLENELKVKSKTSDIALKTSRAVNLFSEQGNISLTLKGDKNKVNSTIQSYQGAVTVMYNEATPLFEIQTGNHITSNSSALLDSKTTSQRSQRMGSDDAKNQIKITTDSGAINLIDLSL